MTKSNLHPRTRQAKAEHNRIVIDALLPSVPKHPLHKVFEIQRDCRGFLKTSYRLRRMLRIRPRRRGRDRAPRRRAAGRVPAVRSRQRLGNLQPKASAEDGDGGDPDPDAPYPLAFPRQYLPALPGALDPRFTSPMGEVSPPGPLGFLYLPGFTIAQKKGRPYPRIRPALRRKTNPSKERLYYVPINDRDRDRASVD